VNPEGSTFWSFTLLQKRRKKWWKSFLQHPELLLALNVDLGESGDELIEQKIRFTSENFGNETIEELTLWKPKVFADLNVNILIFLLIIFQIYKLIFI